MSKARAPFNKEITPERSLQYRHLRRRFHVLCSRTMVTCPCLSVTCCSFFFRLRRMVDHIVRLLDSLSPATSLSFASDPLSASRRLF